MNIVTIKVADLVPYEKNAKMHNETQIKNVAESIKQFGFVQPVVVDKNNVIVIGHCRTEAAKILGINEVPCVSVDDLTDEQVKALRIIDNKTNESPWDIDLLSEELEDLDLSAFDLDFGLDSLIGSFGDEAFENVSDLVVDTFGITFNFQKADQEAVEAYIKKVGKDVIVQRITEEAISNA